MRGVPGAVRLGACRIVRLLVAFATSVEKSWRLPVRSLTPTTIRGRPRGPGQGRTNLRARFAAGEGEADSVSHRCLWCSMMGLTPTAAGSAPPGWSAAGSSDTGEDLKTVRAQRALFLQGLALEPGAFRSDNASSRSSTAGRSAQSKRSGSSQAHAGSTLGNKAAAGRDVLSEPDHSNPTYDVPSSASQVASLERYHEYRRTPSGSGWRLQAVYELSLIHI